MEQSIGVRYCSLRFLLTKFATIFLVPITHPDGYRDQIPKKKLSRPLGVTALFNCP
jgi:hypothetical protein